MSEKCPTCGRAVRKRKPKPTPYELAMAKARVSIAATQASGITLVAGLDGLDGFWTVTHWLHGQVTANGQSGRFFRG